MFGRKARTTTTVDQPDRGFDSFDMRLGDEMRGERATMGKSLMDVQRELRIKASYIAAIENGDLSAFDSLSFVAGYVRSYARYLNLDPEIVFARFCEESGFEGIRALRPLDSESARKASLGANLGAAPSGGLGKASGRAARRAEVLVPPAADPFGGAANPFVRRTTPVFAGFEPGALGSAAVLALLLGGLGYGGWTILQEVQRVNVAPVEASPTVVAELDPLTAAVPEDPADPALASATDGSAADDALGRLYRPQVLEAPILTARDAPISTIAPGAIGALAPSVPSVSTAPTRNAGAPAPAASGWAALAEADMDRGTVPAEAADLSDLVDDAVAEALGVARADADGEAAAPPQVLADAPTGVMLIAVRETWVRVRSADGDTLMERVMQPGDTWTVPQDVAAPTLRTGNSGGVYFSVAGQTYGPVAPGVQVVSNVALAPEAVREGYAVADLSGDDDLARVVAELREPAAPPTE